MHGWDAIGALFWNLNIWDVFWMSQVQMRESAVGRWQMEGGVQVLLGLWLMLGVCTLRVLHESLLLPVLMYGSKTVIWKERSRIRTVDIGNLRGLLDIRRNDKI